MKAKRKRKAVLNQLSLFDDIGNKSLQDLWQKYTLALYKVRQSEKKKTA